MKEGTQSARVSLYYRRDFISVTEDELLVAMAHVVKDAEEDGGARWWYLLIIAMGLLSTGFSTATVISRNITEVMFYMMIGLSAAGGVLAWQYFLYIRELFAYPKKVAAICCELHEALGQLGVIHRNQQS
jgi:hypothetical protein